MTNGLLTSLRRHLGSLISKPALRRRRRPERASTEQLEVRCLLSAVVELVADLNPTQGGTSGVRNYVQLQVNGITFFTGSTLEYGNELWRTDGTDAGTFRLTDCSPGPSSSQIRSLTKLGDLLIFKVQNNSYQDELWRSDGTVAGTQAVQLQPLAVRNTWTLPVIGNFVYFTSGTQLWQSDGTDQGTRPYFDFPQPRWTDTFSSSTNGNFYFVVYDYDPAARSHFSSLWTSDGTQAGTQTIKSFEEGVRLRDLRATNGRVFLTLDAGSSGKQIWTSDGTNNGTKRIADVSWWSEMTVTDERLFFTESFSNDPNNLWTYRWADESLVQLTSFAGGTDQVSIHNLVTFESDVVFLENQQLWRTDGTIVGTTQIAMPIDANVTSITNINGLLTLSLWSATRGAELWTSDGTTKGTSLLKDIHAGTDESLKRNEYIYFPGTRFSGLVFVIAGDGKVPTPIWVTDGTSSGTRRLANLAVGTDSSNPTSILNVDGELVFLTGPSEYYSETLWSSQSAHSVVAQGSASQLGSSDGNVYYVKNTYEIDDESSGIYRWNGKVGEIVLHIPYDFRVVSPPLSIANTHYFLGYTYDPVNCNRIFQIRRSTDDGADSTVVKEFQNANGHAVSEEFQSFSHNDLIYFRATNEIGESQLWRCDGTADGTFVLLDSGIDAFESSKPLFVGTRNQIVLSNGAELIVTDGSVEGTYKLFDRRTVGSHLSGLESLPNNYLFLNELKLWKTDGTKAGTVVIREMGFSSRYGCKWLRLFHRIFWGPSISNSTLEF